MKTKFEAILELDELEIVPAMLERPIDDTLYELGLLMESTFTLDEIAQAYQKVLHRLPDINIESENDHTIIVHLDILWQCIFDNDEILEKYNLIR